MYKIGIDLGGTKIEGVILDPENIQLFRQRVPTEQEHGYEHILKQIKLLYDEMLAHIKEAEHSFGIGTPGALSPRTGLLRNSNTLCLNERPLKENLESLLNHIVEIQNDANCFAMAEALAGAGKKDDLVFGVIMGTGCGGGIVYHKEVFLGKHAIAGEWGHSTLDPAGPECYCGARGCVEKFISGSGLENRFEDIFGYKISVDEMISGFRQGDDQVREFVQQFFGFFGRAMANVINILDPDIIVLGGGLSNIDELYTIGMAEARKCVFSDFCETPIVRNELGDSAGVIGAALIGR